jgi:hypothetical protein
MRRISVPANAKSKSHRKPIRYSSAARPERLSTLLGEISWVRTWEKSAEVVVAKKLSESSVSEGPKNQETNQP